MADTLQEINENARKWLDLVSFAEGTWGRPDGGYRTNFGGGQVDISNGHPNTVVRSGGYASAASGRYQFMPDTWNEVTGQLGRSAGDFSPLAQDYAALHRMRTRGIDPFTAALTPENVAKLAPEWASFPTMGGGSFYGQPSQSFERLRAFWDGTPATPGTSGTGAATASATGTSANPPAAARRPPGFRFDDDNPQQPAATKSPWSKASPGIRTSEITKQLIAKAFGAANQLNDDDGPLNSAAARTSGSDQSMRQRSTGFDPGALLAGQIPLAQAPVLQAPVLQAPVLQAPVLQAPTLEGLMAPAAATIGSPRRRFAGDAASIIGRFR